MWPCLTSSTTSAMFKAKPQTSWIPQKTRHFGGFPNFKSGGVMLLVTTTTVTTTTTTTITLGFAEEPRKKQDINTKRPKIVRPKLTNNPLLKQKPPALLLQRERPHLYSLTCQVVTLLHEATTILLPKIKHLPHGRTKGPGILDVFGDISGFSHVVFGFLRV